MALSVQEQENPMEEKSGEESGTPSERVETGLGRRDQAVLSGHGVIKADRDGHRIGQGLRSFRRIDGAREVSAGTPRQGREGTHSITCVLCVVSAPSRCAQAHCAWWGKPNLLRSG